MEAAGVKSAPIWRQVTGREFQPRHSDHPTSACATWLWSTCGPPRTAIGAPPLREADERFAGLCTG